MTVNESYQLSWTHGKLNHLMSMRINEFCLVWPQPLSITYTFIKFVWPGPRTSFCVKMFEMREMNKPRNAYFRKKRQIYFREFMVVNFHY